MNEDETFEFRLMSLDELDEWVMTFLDNNEGVDRDAVCSLTLALEQLHSFVTSTEAMEQRYKTFIKRGGADHLIAKEETLH